MDDNNYADFSFADIFAMYKFSKHKQDSCRRMIDHFESRPDIYGERDIKRYRERERQFTLISYLTEREMEARLLENSDPAA